jgi:hypothetical protein
LFDIILLQLQTIKIKCFKQYINYKKRYNQIKEWVAPGGNAFLSFYLKNEYAIYAARQVKNLKYDKKRVCPAFYARY